MLAGCSSDQGNGSEATGNGGGAEATPETTDSAGTDAPTDGGNDGSSSQFGQATTFPDSYAMTATMQSGGQSIEMTGRFYQGDTYWSFEQQGQRTEMYHIGNETYSVVGGQCFSGMMQQGMDRDEVDPSGFSERARENPELTPAGRDTIDGEDVLVYELSQSGADDPVTYYILADSGYPRRIEAGSTQWDFHSWGSVDPIQKPEGNCQPMPGGGMTAVGGN